MKRKTKKVCKKCGEFITESGSHPYCAYCDDYCIETETIDITGHKIGECPVCQEKSLRYAKFVMSGLKEGYGWKCESCESQGIEWQEMQFTGHQIVIKGIEEDKEVRK